MADDASRVKALFQEALERPAAERDAFLDEQCGDDDDLHTKVYTLLHALEAAGSFLAEAPSAQADQAEHQTILIGRIEPGKHRQRHRSREGAPAAEA